MKRFTTQPDPQAQEWRNLRDANGRLYGRVNRVQMLLEIRSHQKTMVFDLKELLQVKTLENKKDIE